MASFTSSREAELNKFDQTVKHTRSSLILRSLCIQGEFYVVSCVRDKQFIRGLNAVLGSTIRIESLSSLPSQLQQGAHVSGESSRQISCGLGLLNFHIQGKKRDQNFSVLSSSFVAPGKLCGKDLRSCHSCLLIDGTFTIF